MVSVAFIVVALLSLVSAQSSQYNVTVSFDGGLPFCSQCGENGQYACSNIPGQPPVGNWNNGTKTFTNPAPEGYVVTALTATVYGSFGCDVANAIAVFSLNLNGYLLDVHQGTGATSCKCSTCDGGVTFTSQINANSGYQVDLPSYNYDKPNTVQVLVLADSICVNRIEFSMTAVKATPSLIEMVDKQFVVGHSDCNQNCGTPSICFCPYYDGQPTYSISFKDPLPKGALLLTVAVGIYGAADGAVANKYNFTVSLAGTIIGSVQPTYSGKYLCQGRTFVSADTFYQNGWPGYVYASTNAIYLTVSTTSIRTLCYSTVELQFYYYLPSSTTTSSPHISL